MVRTGRRYGFVLGGTSRASSRVKRFGLFSSLAIRGALPNYMVPMDKDGVAEGPKALVIMPASLLRG